MKPLGEDRHEISDIGMGNSQHWNLMASGKLDFVLGFRHVSRIIWKAACLHERQEYGGRKSMSAWRLAAQPPAERSRSCCGDEFVDDPLGDSVRVGI
jgi:hypothetical protein